MLEVHASMTVKVASAVGIISAMVLVMLPSVGSGFLADDFLDLDHEFSPSTFTGFEAGGFRPLTVAAWAFDSAVWGLTRPAGWHLTNLAIHLLNILLVSILLRRLGMPDGAVFWGTLLFAVSWAVVPSAGRISGRTTMLATAPMLLALILHGAWLGRRRTWILAGACTAFLASLLFKETMLLAAPLFGLQAASAEGDARPVRRFAASTCAFLIPTLLYSLWRLAWIGPVLSYGESSTIGPFMLRNLAALSVMPFSPWLDSIPARVVLLGSAALLVFLRGSWWRRAWIAGLLVLPLATVTNLPPRSDFAYAALPFAAVVIALLARGSRRIRSHVLPAVIVIGCALSARDEVSRLSQAGAYTSATIRSLRDLAARAPGEQIFLEGIEYGISGYGTLWPGAFDSALETAGSGDGSRLHDAGSFWETAWPVVSTGDCYRFTLARADGGGWRTIRSEIEAGLLYETVPDTLLALDPCSGTAVDRALGRRSTLVLAGADADARVLLSDPFDPCSLVAIPPARVIGDTLFFDLESSTAWLIHRSGDFHGILLVDAPGRSSTVLLTSSRLWTEEIARRLEMKEEVRGSG